MAVEISELEQTCREIGKLIGKAVEEHHGKSSVGFCLLLFEFGPSGHLTYLCNAERDTMRVALQEFLERL